MPLVGIPNDVTVSSRNKKGILSGVEFPKHDACWHSVAQLQNERVAVFLSLSLLEVVN